MIEKMLKKFEELRMRYFLTIANGGNEKLDCAYVYVGKAIDQCKEIVQEVAEEYKAPIRCLTCARYTDADTIDNICYLCCKGIEDNYQPKGDDKNCYIN